MIEGTLIAYYWVSCGLATYWLDDFDDLSGPGAFIASMLTGWLVIPAKVLRKAAR